jgi:GNAT superfamily N-acetyltransferase
LLGLETGIKKLVGLGFLNGDIAGAGLSDLMVHPDHQHQGIGRALVKKRVQIADKIGVERMDALLISSNTLKGLYTELGFRAIDDRTVRREK